MSMAMDDSSVPLKPHAAQSGAPGRPNGKQQQAFWDDDAEDEDDVPATGQDDEMYEEAVELVRRLNKASVSLLQRRLRIGYTRAARLIDVMEERGIVGPATEGSKPRMVIPVRPE
jgi:S-DNA-T family DNA segregation ATPase FtsK/SpoIIIE